jgi:hypothetical protein
MPFRSAEAERAFIAGVPGPTKEQESVSPAIIRHGNSSGREAFVMPIREAGAGGRRALWVVLADTPGLAIEPARANGCTLTKSSERYPNGGSRPAGISQASLRARIATIKSSHTRRERSDAPALPRRCRTPR